MAIEQKVKDSAQALIDRGGDCSLASHCKDCADICIVASRKNFKAGDYEGYTNEKIRIAELLVKGDAI